MWAKQKGFTIVELLIVIVVIAILAAISVVAYNGISERTRLNSAYSFAQQLERTYGQTKFYQMTFENNVGSGATVPTEETGGITVGDKDTNINTVATTTGVPGSSYAIDFSGTSGQGIFRNYGKPFPTGSFVISYWARSTTTAAQDGQFLLCLDCGTANQLVWDAVSYSSNYRFRYTPYAGAPSITLTGSGYDRSKWNHVAIIFDKSKQLMTLYINGNKQEEKATFAPSYGSYYFDWGRGDNMGFRGQMDNLKIYSFE